MVQDLWFLFNVAVFMNKYFSDCCQQARVILNYCKTEGYTDILNALKIDLHCGDTGKYDRKTAGHLHSKKLNARKKRALQDVPEDLEERTSCHKKRLIWKKK